jgi:hypothetical protein
MAKDPNSRHKDLATYRVPVAGRQATVDLFQPRFRPLVPPETIAQPVTGRDRLDTLAFELTGDAQGFWRLADLNRAYDPTNLLLPGRSIRAPRRQT